MTSLSACTDCPLHINGFAVLGEGPKPAKYLILGEAPGETEAYLGRPFVGAAGKQLNKLLELADIKRDEVFITNSVKHHPGHGNPKPSISMVRACRKWLDDEIGVVDPDVIICLGQTAAANILGSVNMKRDHGKSFHKVVCGRERKVHVAYHPAAGLHNPSIKPHIEADFRAIKGQAVVTLDNLEVGWIRGIEDMNRSWMGYSHLPLSVDLETTSLNIRTCGLTAVSWSTDTKRSFVSPPSVRLLDQLKSCFQQRRLLIVHNSSFDIPILQRMVQTTVWPKVIDTLLTAYILGKELSLKTRALRELNIKMETYKEASGGEKDSSKADPWRLFPYAAVDAVIPLMLYERDIEEINSIGAQEGLEIEHDLSPIFWQMQKTGIKFDVDKAEALSGELDSHLQDLGCMVWGYAKRTININSTRDVGRLLFDELGVVPLHKTKGGQVSTDKETLKTRIGVHPVIPYLLEWREYTKMRSTFVESPLKMAIEDNGRIHTTFKQYGARLGRPSSESPNLFNIPMTGGWNKKIRSLYVAEDGNEFVDIDISQFEMRAAAALSQDPVMIKIFNDGEDIHDHTCRTILGREPGNSDDRRVAKNIGFGIVYGLSALGIKNYLATVAEPPIYITLEEAQRLHKNAISQFTTLAKKQEEWKRLARERGYVENLFHYRRYLPELQSGDRKAIADAERVAINGPIQGSCGVIMKKAMVELGKDYVDTFRNTVYDSLLLEVRKGWGQVVGTEVAKRIEEIGEGILGVKMKASWNCGDNWGDCK